MRRQGNIGRRFEHGSDDRDLFVRRGGAIHDARIFVFVDQKQRRRRTMGVQHVRHNIANGRGIPGLV